MGTRIAFECETERKAEEPMLGVAVSVTPGVVADMHMTMESSPSTHDVRPQVVQAAPLDKTLSNATVRLLECLRSADDARILGPQIVREITYRVLLGKLGGNLRALAAPQSHFGQISRALHRIHADYARTLDIASLAREGAMS